MHDLIADVEQRLPAASGREHRAIAGVSMGGFGAVVLALKHPDLFIFAAGMSSALDVPSRPFSIKRVGSPLIAQISAERRSGAKTNFNKRPTN